MAPAKCMIIEEKDEMEGLNFLSRFGNLEVAVQVGETTENGSEHLK